MLNYTVFGLTKKDYITIRNEWYKDERGIGSARRELHQPHHRPEPSVQRDFLIRPEIGYYRNWETKPSTTARKKASGSMGST